MIPFTTCMRFNRKRINRGTNKQQPAANINKEEKSGVSSLTGSGWKGLTRPDAQNRLLFTLKRSKAAQRSIHIDPIALLDYSYHGVTDRFLENASNWSFNSFTLDTLTGGHSLSSLLVHLFKKYNFIEEFKLEIINVWKCFRLFENGYHDTNPYHNSVHAADVTQAMHCFIEEEKIGKYLSPMEKMCSLLAAVAHDLDHPGVNQHFLIATKSHLASLYNNLSVLESHHWRFAMSCLKESGIFSHFTKKQWETIQYLLSSLILATDVTQQSAYLKRFRDSLENGTIDMTKPDNRLFIMQIALKCADLGNPCRPWVLSKRWTTQICNEFYRQGDYERQLKMKVTPIFDRRTASIARIQTDFFRNIVAPLFQLWDQFLCSKLSRRIMFNLQFNDSQWTNSLQKVNVKRRHSYETMNEKKKKPRDISKSLDDIMLIEEISLDELKTAAAFAAATAVQYNLATASGNQYHCDDEDDGAHVGKKQCKGTNGCGTPIPSTTRSSSLLPNPPPLISISGDLTDNGQGPVYEFDGNTGHGDLSTGWPRVIDQLIPYETMEEQSTDKVTCLPHSFSALPGYPTSASTITYPSQSLVDTAQYLRGRRGSAPGCIGIYTGCEIAAAALVFLHGAVTESDASSPLPPTSSQPPPLLTSSSSSSYLLHHTQRPSSRSPSPLHHSSSSSSSSTNPSPSSSPLSCQGPPPTSTNARLSLSLPKNNNNSSNKAQKRRSSFPVCDTGYFGYFGDSVSGGGGAGKLTSRKNPSAYLHGSSKGFSPRLKGRSLELLMSSLTAKSKLLTNQSCSLDSASECRSWLVKREERRGSIPQDILIHSLANYSSANAL